MKTASGTASPIRARDFCQSLVAEDDDLTERLLGREEFFGTQIPRSLAFRDAFERNLLRLRTLG